MSAFNQLNVQHSIRTHLAKATGLQAVWIYDGVALPAQKPFITVEQMQNNVTARPKMRDAIGKVLRFQIGLRANTASERARLQAQIEDVFNYDTIALIDAGSGLAAGSFNADLTAVVPMGADDTAATSEYHRVYFDVEIDGFTYRNNRRAN